MRALFLALMLLAPVTLDGELQTREPLTIMTFNIRYGTADDGANHWSARKEDLFEIIRREGTGTFWFSDTPAVVASKSWGNTSGTSTCTSIISRSRRANAARCCCFRVLHRDEPEAGTFNGFKFGNTGGDKIDYVLVARVR